LTREEKRREEKIEINSQYDTNAVLQYHFPDNGIEAESVL